MRFLSSKAPVVDEGSAATCDVSQTGTAHVSPEGTAATHALSKGAARKRSRSPAPSCGGSKRRRVLGEGLPSDAVFKQESRSSSLPEGIELPEGGDSASSPSPNSSSSPSPHSSSSPSPNSSSSPSPHSPSSPSPSSSSPSPRSSSSPSPRRSPSLCDEVSAKRAVGSSSFSPGDGRGKDAPPLARLTGTKRKRPSEPCLPPSALPSHSTGLSPPSIPGVLPSPPPDFLWSPRSAFSSPSPGALPFPSDAPAVVAGQVVSVSIDSEGGFHETRTPSAAHLPKREKPSESPAKDSRPRKKKKKKVKRGTLQKCGICGVEVKYLDEHLRRHVKKECHVCGKLVADLRHHVRNTHSGRKECVVCGKSYVDLRSHMRSAHPTPDQQAQQTRKLVECEICGKLVTSRTKHMLVHADTRTCHLCGAEVKFLECHISSVHSALKQCPICPMRVRNLSKHMRTHSKRTCRICSAEVENLRAHILKDHPNHRDGDKQQCPVCPRKVIDLEGHLKWHASRVRCPREACGKLVGDLRKHLAWHASRTPCEICGKVVQGMASHVRRKHPEVPQTEEKLWAYKRGHC